MRVCFRWRLNQIGIRGTYGHGIRPRCHFKWNSYTENTMQYIVVSSGSHVFLILQMLVMCQLNKCPKSSYLQKWHISDGNIRPIYPAVGWNLTQNIKSNIVLYNARCAYSSLSTHSKLKQSQAYSFRLSQRAMTNTQQIWPVCERPRIDWNYANPRHNAVNGLKFGHN